MVFEKKTLGIFLTIIIVAVAVSSLSTYYIIETLRPEENVKAPIDDELGWTDTFNITNIEFNSTGYNPYFILEVGYTLILEGNEDGNDIRLIINVTDQTINISGVECRIVIEDERFIDGDIIEISYNYFAFDNRTNDVYYFGEDVDIYENGVIVDHSGAWKAGVGDNMAGIMMLGTPIVGARYYQELAEDYGAMDRSEILSIGSTLTVPKGTFENCLITEETTILEPLTRGIKYYAYGVGFIGEGELLLKDYGYYI